jgi:hypothetical protein
LYEVNLLDTLTSYKIEKECSHQITDLDYLLMYLVPHHKFTLQPQLLEQYKAVTYHLYNLIQQEEQYVTWVLEKVIIIQLLQFTVSI